MKNSKKILIIDDEPDVLEFLSYNFRKHGFNILTAGSGAEGIQMAKEGPDLIISDIMMPGMDGIEMCRLIRSAERSGNTPFIFLTAVNDDYKVLYAMGAGADQIASKPIRFEYLYEMVLRIMDEKKTL
jgi:two-component system alkaline phosphatase synthesis response regulator PhoP